jgi:hypothetical protein
MDTALSQIRALHILCFTAVPYIAQAVRRRRPGFELRSGHMGFVVEKPALGQIFSEYFGFPCHFSFHRLLHIHHHLSSGAGTIGQLVSDVPSRLSLTSPQETKRNIRVRGQWDWGKMGSCRRTVRLPSGTLSAHYGPGLYLDISMFPNATLIENI